MPVYSLTSTETITDSKKLELVNAVTDTHCSITGAPEQFVHVLFSDGIPITGGKSLYIHANTRAGRPDAVVQELRNRLMTESARILDLNVTQVHINLLEIQSRWIMEGGFVMPEPGEEEEWMNKVHAALSHRS